MVRAVVVMVALVGLVGGVESGGVAAPRTFRAVVIAVDGGDTLRVVPLAGKASAPLSVRIAGIAAPKRDQRSGAAARAFVDERVF
ncbi:MAG: hypothetical protein KC503_20860, partial [Myxococcales bacterium]|nr:hypothetical protein [Myxococcales bacterium]